MAKKRLYLANQYGFSETGRLFLDKIILPPLEREYKVYEPFRDGGIIRDLKSFDEATKKNSYHLKNADILAAILDGSHAVDDGTASEIAEYAKLRKKGRIVALRTDIRRFDTLCSVNPQIDYYIDKKGKFFTSIDSWFQELEIKDWQIKK